MCLRGLLTLSMSELLDADISRSVVLGHNRTCMADVLGVESLYLCCRSGRMHHCVAMAVGMGPACSELVQSVACCC